MQIRDILKTEKLALSFEVFPPVREGNLDMLFTTIGELTALDPDFISVTYGAGGGTRHMSFEIAERVKRQCRQEVLAHLTCVGSTRDDIDSILEEFRSAQIENILALRGDPPKGEETFKMTPSGFGHANELVEFIRSSDRRFSVGVAGYPEGHPEAPDLETDLRHLKRKVDCGADFIITQLFFDNEYFYRFRESAERIGIAVPILPGIFPIFNYKQIKRIVPLCGATIPGRLESRIYALQDKPEEIEKYGIEFATRQADELIRNEARGIHIYSMNRSGPAIRIVSDLNLRGRDRPLAQGSTQDSR